MSKAKELGILEQNMNSILTQKQTIQAQLLEVGSAFGELQNTTESYRIIGNIIIKKDTKELLSELDEKKKLLELRMRTIEKQEGNLKQKMQDLQQEVMKDVTQNERGNA